MDACNGVRLPESAPPTSMSQLDCSSIRTGAGVPQPYCRGPSANHSVDDVPLLTAEELVAHLGEEIEETTQEADWLSRPRVGGSCDAERPRVCRTRGRSPAYRRRPGWGLEVWTRLRSSTPRPRSIVTGNTRSLRCRRGTGRRRRDAPIPRHRRLTHPSRHGTPPRHLPNVARAAGGDRRGARQARARRFGTRRAALNESRRIA